MLPSVTATFHFEKSVDALYLLLFDSTVYQRPRMGNASVRKEPIEHRIKTQFTVPDDDR